MIEVITLRGMLKARILLMEIIEDGTRVTRYHQYLSIDSLEF